MTTKANKLDLACRVSQKVLEFDLPPELAYLVTDAVGEILWAESRTRLKNDPPQSFSDDSLSQRLLKIEGVEDVRCHGMLGPHIWVTVNVPFRNVRQIRKCVIDLHSDVQAAIKAKAGQAGQEECEL